MNRVSWIQRKGVALFKAETQGAIERRADFVAMKYPVRLVDSSQCSSYSMPGVLTASIPRQHKTDRCQTERRGKPYESTSRGRMKSVNYD